MYALVQFVYIGRIMVFLLLFVLHNEWSFSVLIFFKLFRNQNLSLITSLHQLFLHMAMIGVISTILKVYSLLKKEENHLILKACFHILYSSLLLACCILLFKNLIGVHTYYLPICCFCLQNDS